MKLGDGKNAGLKGKSSHAFVIKCLKQSFIPSVADCGLAEIWKDGLLVGASH